MNTNYNVFSYVTHVLHVFVLSSLLGPMTNVITLKTNKKGEIHPPCVRFFMAQA